MDYEYPVYYGFSVNKEITERQLEQMQTTENIETLLSSLRPRLEVFHGLAVASELAGYLNGVDKPFRQKIDKMLEPCIETLRSEMKAIMDTFENTFTAELNQVNFLANGILVKEKENISVQTESVTRETASAQTIEPPTPKATPKPKGKK